MKKTVTLLIIIFFAVVSTASAVFQEEPEKAEKREIPKGKDYFLNLSLCHPVSINKTREDRVNINLSLIYGHVGYISGFDLSLLASAATHKMTGVQISGLTAVTGESGSGMQLSGLITVAGEEFTGFQAGGLICVSGEKFKGWQSSGLMNVIGESGSGFQAAGLANVAGERYSGVQIGGGFNVIGERGSGGQISGLFNVCGEDFEGVQISGLFNVTGEDFKGLQVGPINVAVENHGVQLGVANLQQNSDGLQLGIVNYTKKENTGIPIGLVNLAENGRIKGIFWGGNQVAVTGGVKFLIGGRYYSIVSLGGYNLDDDIAASFSYGFHYGLRFPIRKFNLNTDIGFRYRDNKPLFKQNDKERDQWLFEARLSLGIPVSNNLSFLVGTGYSRRWNTVESVEKQGRALIFAGLEIY